MATTTTNYGLKKPAVSDTVTIADINGNMDIIDTKINETCPPGLVVFLARNTAPTGWLKANGALVSRTTYSRLFSVIGTTFGVGDGSTTFALPDLRGYFPRAWDDGRGIDSGRVFGSTQEDSFKSHTHNVAVPGGTGSYANTLSAPANVSNPPGLMGTTDTGGTETRPRNIALLGCIKY